VFPPEFIEAMKKINLTQVRERRPGTTSVVDART